MTVMHELSRSYKVGDATSTKYGYSGASHVTGYDALRLSSSMLFFTVKGTVFTNCILWAETLLLLTIFAITNRVFAWLDIHQEDIMKGVEPFVGRISTLAAFLIGFYTSATMARWWTIRTQGIGKTWGAMRQLTFWMSEIVTRDAEIHAAVRRYARASMAIAFFEHRKGPMDDKLEALTKHGFLTEEERDNILTVGANHSKVPWSWIAAIVEGLNKNGSMGCDNTYAFLMSAVSDGRNGLEVIGTYLGTPIPLPYVHLLGFLVKLHNIFLALCYAYTSADCGCDYLFYTLKVLLIPFLYNALLLINAELSNPLDGQVNDFPLGVYEKAMETEGKAFYEAANHRPDWIEKNPVLKAKPKDPRWETASSSPAWQSPNGPKAGLAS
jgi:predicted membrane chloride channel (bestrophin family)